MTSPESAPAAAQHEPQKTALAQYQTVGLAVDSCWPGPGSRSSLCCSLGTARVPTHLAELYQEILNQDGALRPWVETGDPLLTTIYGLAFRMVAERRVRQC